MKPLKNFAITTALLAATLATATITASRVPEHLAYPLETIPRQLGDWVGSEDRSLGTATENVLKASAYLSRTYQRGDETVDFFTAFYALQEAGEAMHSPQNCLPGSGWEVWSHDTVDVVVAGKTATLNYYGIQNGNRRMVVIYWYQTPERIVASEYYAKLCLVWDAVLRSRVSGSIVRVIVPDRPEAVRGAVEFVTHIIPQMQRCLPSISQ